MQHALRLRVGACCAWLRAVAPATARGVRLCSGARDAALRHAAALLEGHKELSLRGQEDAGLVADAKELLRGHVTADADARGDAAYLMGLAYLRDPYDRPAPDETASEGKGAAEKVVEELRAIRRAAREARRQRIESLTSGAAGRPRRRKGGGGRAVDVSVTRAGEKILVGVGVYYQAWRWLLRAALKGNVPAMVRLGNLCVEQIAEDTSGGRRNVPAAVTWYVRAAAAPRPSADAMYNLAKLYYEGVGDAAAGVLAQDARLARFWLERAAGAGDGAAALWLAHAARCGDGDLAFSDSDGPAAAAWLERALEARAEGAAFYAAQLYRAGDAALGVAPERAAFWRHLEAGLAEEDADCLQLAGDAYYHGSDGAARDVRRAVELYARSAERGGADAAMNLGALYAQGIGVGQDFAKALYWYEVATEGGNVLAWQNIAAMYALGQGVPKDEERSRQIMRTWGPRIQEFLEDRQRGA